MFLHSKLHHIDLKGYYQFITFRTKDSIDEYVKKVQMQNNISVKNREYEIDKYLDNLEKGSYFFGRCIDIMKEILLEKDGIFYDVEVFVIMPNHIHILLKQKVDLATIMKFIKGKSAVLLNRELKRVGKFWVEGYFDRVVRDEKHFENVYDYILGNPRNLLDKDDRVYSRY